jgi:hypothetical protein
MLAVGADTRPIVPAPLAFIVTALLGRNCGLARSFLQFHLADNAKGSKLLKAELI